MPVTRRDFLLKTSAIAATGLLPLPASARPGAAAALQNEFRALVCVFLSGGNDSFNMLVPRSAAEYAAYARSRRNLAIERSDLLPVRPRHSDGSQYGLHPSLAAVRNLFDRGAAAFVTNVGPLHEPVTKAACFDGTVELPSRLFAHDAQREHWFDRAGQLGGRKGPDFPSSPAATATALRCPDGCPVQGSPTGPVLKTVFPGSQLGQQLAAVARRLAVRDELALSPQLFQLVARGFDTHDDQVARQPGLFRDLSESIAAFYAATIELGIAERVTTFTQSEFGRTLTTNGGGSDHGWGGNQLVVGAAVRGGDLYGRYPLLAVNGDEDIGGGRLIPSTSTDQYVATLARWMAVPDRDMSCIAPHIGNFAVKDIGFMA